MYSCIATEIAIIVRFQLFSQQNTSFQTFIFAFIQHLNALAVQSCIKAETVHNGCWLFRRIFYCSIYVHCAHSFPCPRKRRTTVQGNSDVISRVLSRFVFMAPAAASVI